MYCILSENEWYIFKDIIHQVSPSQEGQAQPRQAQEQEPLHSVFATATSKELI